MGDPQNGWLITENPIYRWMRYDEMISGNLHMFGLHVFDGGCHTSQPRGPTVNSVDVEV